MNLSVTINNFILDTHISIEIDINWYKIVERFFSGTILRNDFGFLKSQLMEHLIENDNYWQCRILVSMNYDCS